MRMRSRNRTAGLSFIVGLGFLVPSAALARDATSDYLDSLGSLSVDLWGTNVIDPAFTMFVLDASAGATGTVGGDYFSNLLAFDINYVDSIPDEDMANEIYPTDPALALQVITDLQIDCAVVSGAFFSPTSSEHYILGFAMDISPPGHPTYHLLQVFTRLDGPFSLAESSIPQSLTRPDDWPTELRFPFPRGPGFSLKSTGPCADPNNPAAPTDKPITASSYPCGYGPIDGPIFCQLCDHSHSHFTYSLTCEKSCCDTYRDKMVSAALGYNSSASSSWQSRENGVTAAQQTLAADTRSVAVGGGALIVTGVATVFIASGVGAFIGAGILVLGGGALGAGGAASAADTYQNTVNSLNSTYCTSVNGAQSTYDTLTNDAFTTAVLCLCGCCSPE